MDDDKMLLMSDHKRLMNHHNAALACGAMVLHNVLLTGEDWSKRGGDERRRDFRLGTVRVSHDDKLKLHVEVLSPGLREKTEREEATEKAEAEAVDKNKLWMDDVQLLRSTRRTLLENLEFIGRRLEDGHIKFDDRFIEKRHILLQDLQAVQQILKNSADDDGKGDEG